MGQFRRVREKKNCHKKEGGGRGGEISPEREAKRTEVGKKRERLGVGGGGSPPGGCCEVKVPVCGVRWPPARGCSTLQRSVRQS